MTDAIWIGNRRELFWDEYLIEKGKTTAVRQLNKLQPKEVAIHHNAPWEGDGCNYHCIVKDDGLYRMYYLGWEMLDPDVTRHDLEEIAVCYAESENGKDWIKPNLGICEYGGFWDNNIILDSNTAKFDNFYVFKDSKPDCPGEERYKATAIDWNDNYLWCYTSSDGIKFQKSWRMTNQGKFDSLNVAFWDGLAKKYRCYIRDFHDIPGNDWNAGIRDIRWMESDDFRQWTKPERLYFGEGEDYPLYTNAVQPYDRAPHLLVGFPSRYVEKKAWTPNFDDFAGAQSREKRMCVHPRYGLTITDCLFMSSRDGRSWNRWDEAFMTPGLEHLYNWVYGDCFPAVGMIETVNDLPYAPNELSMYAKEGHWSQQPAKLRRYTIRIDGFVSYRATYKPCQITTKPFLYEGGRLSVNFATSARGYMKVKLVSGERTLNSIELFGDSLDKTVVFTDGDPSSLSGKPVTMEITMSDAELYSFQFNE
ncbi:hypothetical protein [Paenibacillus eucommiae]|uniref:Uncharacterized protein n=1 Tax=Paenibacillus eucommiae TaxID=1355755 RepID=A0ABS4J4G8_9BACL|nr:hypothetical protein [Paenibacillus eucommiae]MBP1994710.1 hypothetical protein [Paenibacillus eucommiae]